MRIDNILAKFVDLAEPDCPESCPLGGKGESTDAAEEVEVRWLIHPTPRNGRSAFCTAKEQARSPHETPVSKGCCSIENRRAFDVDIGTPAKAWQANFLVLPNFTDALTLGSNENSGLT